MFGDLREDEALLVADLGHRRIMIVSYTCHPTLRFSLSQMLCIPLSGFGHKL